MTIEAWQQPELPSVAALLCGWRIGVQRDGEPAPVGDSVLVLVNRQLDPLDFTLPALAGDAWAPRIDTRTAGGVPAREGEPRSGVYTVAGRSCVVLTQPPPQTPPPEPPTE
jgi:hypothetical protein